METRKRSTDVRDFAKRLILSKEYESTLRRRVLSGQVSRDFAKTLLGYAHGPRGTSPRVGWFEERPMMETLQKIADGKTEH